MNRVSIRRKKKNKGTMYSLYLEYNPTFIDAAGKTIRYEFLSLEIFVNPANSIQEKHNQLIEEIVETIRCERYISLVKKDYSFVSINRSDEDFLVYFLRISSFRGIKFQCSLLHFQKFCKGNCKFKDITASYCENFKSYLLHCGSIKGRKRLCRNTASAYFSAFMSVVSLAYKDGIIQDNIESYVSRISWEHHQYKEYLIEKEIQQLKNTAFLEFPEVKKASLFSIYTGLRRSDIISLDWENIHLRTKKDTYLKLIANKTKVKFKLPLSPIAVELLGVPQKKGKVFKGLSEALLNKQIPKLIEAASIKKHITFHCFRHTFAMRLLNKGVDIYTIATLLGHKQVSSTQIYAKISQKEAKKAILKLT